MARRVTRSRGGGGDEFKTPDDLGSGPRVDPDARVVLVDPIDSRTIALRKAAEAEEFSTMYQAPATFATPCGHRVYVRVLTGPGARREAKQSLAPTVDSVTCSGCSAVTYIETDIMIREDKVKDGSGESHFSCGCGQPWRLHVVGDAASFVPSPGTTNTSFIAPTICTHSLRWMLAVSQ
jgi:hypothetical protein